MHTPVKFQSHLTLNIDLAASRRGMDIGTIFPLVKRTPAHISWSMLELTNYWCCSLVKLWTCSVSDECTIMGIIQYITLGFLHVPRLYALNAVNLSNHTIEWVHHASNIYGHELFRTWKGNICFCLRVWKHTHSRPSFLTSIVVSIKNTILTTIALRVVRKLDHQRDIWLEQIWINRVVLAVILTISAKSPSFTVLI